MHAGSLHSAPSKAAQPLSKVQGQGCLAVLHQQNRCKTAAPARERSTYWAPSWSCQVLQSEQPGPTRAGEDLHYSLAPGVWTEAGQAWLASLAEQLFPSAATPALQPQPNSQVPWTLLERRPFAGGWLEHVRWEASPSSRLLRVWLPPGYYKVASDRSTSAGKTKGSGNELVHSGPPEGGWPVLYLQDAQNVFEDKLSFSGHSWRAAHTAETLIKNGELPPFVIVAMDHAGPQRSYDFLPCKPGTGPGGWRIDAANWPGGGVVPYMDRVANEVMPWAHIQYGVSSNPARVAMGGSSFGGIFTLCMSMKYPSLFDSALVESPSLWIDTEQFLKRDLAEYSGEWPSRMWVAMGSSEYKGDGNQVFSRMLVGYWEALMRLLQNQGLQQDVNLKGEIGLGAAHTESAWATRLPKALRHLCKHWKTTANTQHPQQRT